MIKSMTAFATSEVKKDRLGITVEMRAYNSRHLDIVLRNAHKYFSVEDRIKNLITSQMGRGRLEVNLHVNDESDDSSTYEINKPKAKAYHDALQQLKKMCKIDVEIALDLIVHAGDIITPGDDDIDLDLHWPLIAECLNQAMIGLNKMKMKEGSYIADDILKRIEYISDCLSRIETNTEDIANQYHERLKERINILTKGIVEIDPERIAQEAAILADKSDISEEIVRVSSHLEQFQMIMESDEPAGRKLNFLLQELNREFNTMGSKVGKAKVSHIIVDVKSELEKIREQVQNIE